MQPESQMLGWLGVAIILGIVQLLAATMASTQQRGFKWNLSSRDVVVPPITGKTARLDRAFKNFLETFPFFVASVLIAITVPADIGVTGCMMYVRYRSRTLRSNLRF
jgi:uncharacterized MAPEG superfamily protein